MNGQPTNSPALLDTPSFQASGGMERLLRAISSSTGEEMEQVLQYVPNHREKNRWAVKDRKDMVNWSASNINILVMHLKSTFRMPRRMNKRTMN